MLNVCRTVSMLATSTYGMYLLFLFLDSCPRSTTAKSKNSNPNHLLHLYLDILCRPSPINAMGRISAIASKPLPIWKESYTFILSSLRFDGSHPTIRRRNITTNQQTQRRQGPMAKTVQEALKEGELFTDHLNYSFLKFPVSSLDHASSLHTSPSLYPSAFRALLVDKDEITMMIPQEDWQSAHSSSSPYDHDHNNNNDDNDVKKISKDWEVGDHVYRLITFDVVMDPNLIGFMYQVTKVLAAEQISVLPFAAYSRDHIFVQDQDYEKAMNALERLKNSTITTTQDDS